MPTFRVTAPDGRKIKLTGDSPPTEAELEEVFKSLPAPPPPITSQEEHLDTQPSGFFSALMSGGAPLAAAPVTGPARGRPESLKAPAIAAGGMAAGEAIATLPPVLKALMSSILRFEVGKRGSQFVMKEAGVPANVAGPVSTGIGFATGGAPAARTLEMARGALTAAPTAARAATTAVEAAAPAAETAVAAVPRLAAGTSTTAAARVASEMAPSVSGAASIPAAVAPRAATAAETMAEEIAAKVVKLKTSTGLSEAQIASSIRELYKMTPANAKLLVRTVLSSLPK